MHARNRPGYSWHPARRGDTFRSSRREQGEECCHISGLKRTGPCALPSGRLYLWYRPNARPAEQRAGVLARRGDFSVPIRADPRPKVSMSRTPFSEWRLRRSVERGGPNRAHDVSGDASTLSPPFLPQEGVFLQTWSRAVFPRVGRHVVCSLLGPSVWVVNDSCCDAAARHGVRHMCGGSRRWWWRVRSRNWECPWRGAKGE